MREESSTTPKRKKSSPSQTTEGKNSTTQKERGEGMQHHTKGQGRSSATQGVLRPHFLWAGVADVFLPPLGWCCFLTLYFGWCCFPPLFGWCCRSPPSVGWRCFAPLSSFGWRCFLPTPLPPFPLLLVGGTASLPPLLDNKISIYDIIAKREGNYIFLEKIDCNINILSVW